MTEFLLPMLAVPGVPFDSDEYLFEVKWDGLRALASTGAAGWRLWGRDRADYTARYPDLDVLRGLPQGCVLDGELVCLAPGGLPDLDALQTRHQTTTPARLARACQAQPVHYVVFDLLAERGRSLLGQPLRLRRQRLQALVERRPDPRLVFSAGVVGAGRAFFEAVVQQGQEGMLAKHLASGYRPGRRVVAWRKCKPTVVLPGVIVGVVRGRNGPQALRVAVAQDGRLCYAATVPCPQDAALRAALAQALRQRVRKQPLVDCPGPAVWVEPELYGQVRGLGWLPNGRLRGASFRALRDPARAPRGASHHPEAAPLALRGARAGS